MTGAGEDALSPSFTLLLVPPPSPRMSPEEFGMQTKEGVQFTLY